MEALRGATIVITGATGQVGGPLAKSLARDNEVWAIARFSEAGTRDDLEAAGVHTAKVDLSVGDFSEVPVRPTHVLHFARANVGQWEPDLAMNVGGVLSLMEFASGATAFLHCSTTAVYQATTSTPRFTESAALGDNHRIFADARSPDISTYSISKIAAEGAARWGAQRFDVPTVIARICVPYGLDWSWPGYHLDQIVNGQPVLVHSDGRTEYNPIHDDDIAATLPGLLAAAAIPAITVNWGGVEVVSIEEWSTYFGELIGKPVTFERSAESLKSVSVDTSLMEQLAGPSSVAWKEGFRAIVEARYPQLLQEPSQR
ncbi:MAG TPA: NAD-dependent epimerase/dehydratase family protein [Ilumatobacteraceae bacterium]